MTYSAQNLVVEGRYKFNKGRGVDALGHRISLVALFNCCKLTIIITNWSDQSHFYVPLNLGRPPYIQIWEINVSQSNNTNSGSRKQMEERWTHGHLLCGWSHSHSITKLQSDYQHCLQKGYRIQYNIWWILALHMLGLHINILL